MQTTSELSDGREWSVAHVDSTGWLSAGGGLSAGGQADDGGHDEAQVATSDQRTDGRRAGSRGRTGRGVGRRVDGDGFRRSLPAGRRRKIAPARTAAPPLVALERADPDLPPPTGVQVGYRMGRSARLALTLTAVAAIAVVLTMSLTAGSAAPQLVDVKVSPGDSLWSIAARSAPDRDPRAVIDDIRELNGLSGDLLSVGIVLRVPAAA